jgi:hypothetical protein
MKLRWDCIRAAKDQVRDGATVDAVAAAIANNPVYATLFTGLSAADKQLSVTGIMKIVAVQMGGPKKA